MDVTQKHLVSQTSKKKAQSYNNHNKNVFLFITVYFDIFYNGNEKDNSAVLTEGLYSSRLLNDKYFCVYFTGNLANDFHWAKSSEEVF